MTLRDDFHRSNSVSAFWGPKKCPNFLRPQSLFFTVFKHVNAYKFIFFISYHGCVITRKKHALSHVTKKCQKTRFLAVLGRFSRALCPPYTLKNRILTKKTVHMGPIKIFRKTPKNVKKRPFLRGPKNPQKRPFLAIFDDFGDVCFFVMIMPHMIFFFACCRNVSLM